MSEEQSDPESLEVENDPRGGLQSEEYRRAHPTDLVEQGDTAMMGPGGAPPRDEDDEDDEDDA